MKKFFLISLLTLMCSVMAWAGNQAKIVGGDEYATLAEAVAAANANDEVQLLESVTLSAQLDITKAMTLNLNGNDITLSNVMIKACQYGNLTISGTGTIHRNETSSGTYALRADSVTLTIESATVEGGYFSLGLFNGSHGIVGADATIQTISGSYGAVYINHAGTSLTNNGTIISTVNQGTINSGSKSTGTITNNGTITATSTTSNTAPVRVCGTLTNSGTITSATTLQPAVFLFGSNAAFNMTGGSISGVKYALGLTATNNTLNISGGEIRATGSDGQGIHTNAGTNSTINITGGSIYGGPYGPYTGLEVGANMADPIRIHGNCTLTIDGEDALIQGNNFRSVAIVNTNGSEKTTVYLKNGTLKGGLFNNGLMMDEKNLTTVYMTGGQILNIEREDERTDNFTYLPGVCHFEMSGGYIEGAAGIGIKSGTFIMTGGTIKALDAPQIINAWNGGMWSAGGALQIESNKNYSGNVNITISGGELISEQGGCAIYEFVEDANDPTVVSSLSVTGGRFQGGVNLSQSLTSKGGFISGGKWSKDITAHVVAGKAANPIDEDPYFFEVGDPTAATAEITTETQTAVLTNAASASEVADYTSANVGDNAEVKTSTATNAVVISENTDVVATEAAAVVDVKKITVEDGNKLTVTEGATLQVGVGAIHLDEDATSEALVVEAGATLVVDGLVYGATADNFAIESQEAKPAVLLFSPETEFIREDHPQATYRFTSKAYTEGGKYVYQRFGIPTFDGNVHMKSLNSSYDSYINKWNFENDDWNGWVLANDIDVVSDNPFQGYMLGSTNPKAVVMTYEFAGELMGNKNANLHFYYGWNYYANSYTAPINIEEFIKTVKATVGSEDILATIYLYKDLGDDTYTWQAINQTNAGTEYTDFSSGMPELVSLPSEIQPMQAFLMKLSAEGSTVDQEINYKDNVYDPAMGLTPPSAPTRNRRDINRMQVSVFNAEGWDNVFFAESDNFSSDLDNGYDAEKYEQTNGVKLYAMNNETRMEILASDNIEGTFMGIDAPKAGNYTLHFSGINGMEYNVIDMQTNAIINITEGVEYNFYTEAGKHDYRFHIVGQANTPTAIDNTEAKANVEGIYTITGQFVGNDFNAVPAGIYVVNGVKVVK